MKNKNQVKEIKKLLKKIKQIKCVCCKSTDLKEDLIRHGLWLDSQKRYICQDCDMDTVINFN